jgi:hypothetical protein
MFILCESCEAISSQVVLHKVSAAVQTLAQAMPKRKVIGADDLKVDNVPYIAIGAKKPPVHIPLLVECGVTCVAINSTDVWLTNVVGDRTRSDKHFIIKDFIAVVLSALSKERPAEEEIETAGRPSERETAGRLAGEEAVGRRTLVLDDDSDAEALEDIPMDEDKDDLSCASVVCSVRVMQPATSMTSWSGHEEPGESQASKRRRSAEVLHGAGYDFMDLAERVGDWLVERLRTYKMSMEVQLRCMPDGRG